jgi:fumarate reductase flavoprotein subunit
MRRSRLLALAILAVSAAAFVTHPSAQSSAAPSAAPGAGHGFLIDKHVGAGLACNSCHSESPPSKQPDSAVCMTCHGSYPQIAAKTATDEPNPHASHLGDIPCTNCHHIHQASVIYCSQCHSFDMTPP